MKQEIRRIFKEYTNEKIIFDDDSNLIELLKDNQLDLYPFIFLLDEEFDVNIIKEEIGNMNKLTINNLMIIIRYKKMNPDLVDKLKEIINDF
jgi:acyl carrier protein